MIVYFCLSGKQYVARKGDVIVNCPHVRGEVGDTVWSEEVLGVDSQIGTPEGQFLPNVKVELKIVKQGKRKKLRIVNFKPQKRHEKWKGFRAKYTNLEVIDINWSK